MIDEFQDIDPPQYRLMEVLSAYHKNLFIVGDPDQTIYTWRGADVRFLLEFDTRFKGTKTILMNENYRSSPQILAAVNSLIDHNRNRIRKALSANCPEGLPVQARIGRTPADEAEHIADRMEKLHEEGVPWEDMTLLYRSHYLARSAEEELTRREIPYTLYGGAGFFDRAEVRTALSYLRFLAYEDDLAFARIVNVPKRNMGRRRMEFLEQYASAHGCTLYNALRATLDDEIFKGTQAARFVEGGAR